MVHTAPVFAAIVWIWEPSIRRVLAVVSVAATVRTDCWFSCWFRSHAVPVFPAVEGVREVASTSSLTVKNVAAVLCCGPLGGGVAVPGIHTGTVATLHIKGI